MSIVNGIGYDEWASKLLAASPELEPHRTDRRRRARAEGRRQPPPVVLADLGAQGDRRDRRRLQGSADPATTPTSTNRKQPSKPNGLGRIQRTDLADQVAATRGLPVGASESIFEPLAPSLGLKLITPTGFMDGIAEGTEPTPSEKATRRRTDQGQADQGLGLQQPERDPRREAPERRSRSSRNSDRHRDRDDDPRRRELPGSGWPAS